MALLDDIAHQAQQERETAGAVMTDGAETITLPANGPTPAGRMGVVGMVADGKPWVRLGYTSEFGHVWAWLPAHFAEDFCKAVMAAAVQARSGLVVTGG